MRLCTIVLGLVNEFLVMASGSQFTSIAIPAIGTGYLGFPHQVVASTLYHTAKEFLEKNPSGPLQKVVLAVHAADAKSKEVCHYLLYLLSIYEHIFILFLF